MKLHIENGEFAGLKREERVRNRSTGPAGTNLHDALARCVWQFTGETFGKAGPIGVVPDRSALPAPLRT